MKNKTTMTRILKGIVLDKVTSTLVLSFLGDDRQNLPPYFLPKSLGLKKLFYLSGLN